MPLEDYLKIVSDETQVATAEMPRGVLEVWVDKDDIWTIYGITDDQTTACVFGVGRRWQNMNTRIPGKDT